MPGILWWQIESENDIIKIIVDFERTIIDETRENCCNNWLTRNWKNYHICNH